MIINKNISIFLFLVAVLFTVSSFGQPRPTINKSLKPDAFATVLPGISNYSFYKSGEEKVNFIEAYFIEELKKWMNSKRPNIFFGTDYKVASPEHLYIDFSYNWRTRLASNGVWWWDVTNAIVSFTVGGLEYKYQFSISDFSVEGNNFDNHTLYNRLNSNITNRVFYYNKSSALHLAKYLSGYNEIKIKEILKRDGSRLYEGIYEDLASDNGYKNNKYKLALKYIDDKPCLIYLNGAYLYDDWQEGEYKAWLEPTASPNIFKAKWLMAYKSLKDAYVSFENGVMKVSVSSSSEIDTYIKLFPSATDNIAIIGSQASEWTGSGFSLKDSYIVTNFHVVDGAKTININGINGDFSKSYSGTVVATDKNNDLAIIKVEGANILNGKIPYSVKTTTSEVGEDIFVLGYPLTATMGDEIKLTTGVISSKSGYQGDVSLYQISAPIQPGNSGGPLFDGKGNIIGIVSAKHKDAENVGYAIKTSYLRNLMESVFSTNILPQNNIISNTNLSGKVKAVKNYVYLIVCSK